MNTSTAWTYLSSRLRGAVETEDRRGERWLNETAGVSSINRLYDLGFLGPPLLQGRGTDPSVSLVVSERTHTLHPGRTPGHPCQCPPEGGGGYFHIAERITAPPPLFLPTQNVLSPATPHSSFLTAPPCFFFLFLSSFHFCCCASEP